MKHNGPAGDFAPLNFGQHQWRPIRKEDFGIEVDKAWRSILRDRHLERKAQERNERIARGQPVAPPNDLRAWR